MKKNKLKLVCLYEFEFDGFMIFSGYDIVPQNFQSDQVYDYWKENDIHQKALMRHLSHQECYALDGLIYYELYNFLDDSLKEIIVCKETE